MEVRNALGILLVGGLLLGGCAEIRLQPAHRHGTHAHPGRGHGPPPHAPAHGHRAKHRDADLRFDSRLGVYVVIDLPGHYYLDGRFYREGRDGWEVALDLGGRFRVAPADALPPGLAKKSRGDKYGRGKSRGRGHPANAR